MRASGDRSPLRSAIVERIERDPLTVARVLAERYPEEPKMSYIPGVAWVNTLRLAALTDDAELAAKVLRDVRPWLEGETPFGDQAGLPTIAGTMVFSQIAKMPDLPQATAAKLAAQGVAVAAEESEPGRPRHGSGWSDDLFLGTVAAAHAAEPDGLDAAAHLILAYADRLQQPSGLYHHAEDAATAWGRGNGFGAMGVAETLTALPQDHPDRSAILEGLRPPHERTGSQPGARWHVAPGCRPAGYLSRGQCHGPNLVGDGAGHSAGLARRFLRARRRARVARAPCSRGERRHNGGRLYQYRIWTDAASLPRPPPR